MSTEQHSLITEQVMVLGQQLFAALNQVVVSHIEVARICHEIAEVVGKQNFAATAAQLFPDMSVNYLSRHLLLWQKIRAHRQVTEWAGQNFSKALALVQAIDEEALAEVEAGQGQLSLDAIDKMSVRQLKYQLRRLTSDKDKLVAEETRALVAERDSLIKKVKETQNAPNAFMAKLQELNQATQQLRQLVLGTAELMAEGHADGAAASLAEAEVEAAVTVLRGEIDTIWSLWMERTGHA